MNRRDYNKAIEIVRKFRRHSDSMGLRPEYHGPADVAMQAFIELFRDDGPIFNECEFIKECKR